MGGVWDGEGFNKKSVIDHYKETAANIAPDVSTSRKRRKVFENALSNRNPNLMKLCLDKGHNPMHKDLFFGEHYHQQLICSVSKYEGDRLTTIKCLNVLSEDTRTDFSYKYTIKQGMGYSLKGNAVTHVIHALTGQNKNDDVANEVLITLFKNSTARVSKTDIAMFEKNIGRNILGIWDETANLLYTRHKEELGLGSSERAPKFG